MAKVAEEQILVKISQLSEDDRDAAAQINDELLSTIESVVKELVEDRCVVEAEKKTTRGDEQ